VTAPGGVLGPAPFEQARAALDHHLERVLAGRRLSSVGWKRPDPLTLYIPVRGYSGTTDATAYGFDPADSATADEQVFGGYPEGDDFGPYPRMVDTGWSITRRNAA
jgi:hypothetical protein